MPRFRPLPWDYGIRNLLRRPLRTLLTLGALTLVVLLVFVVVGFLRGLDRSLENSGDARVVWIHTLGASENIENSSVPANTAALAAASLSGIQRRTNPGGETMAYVSPELYLGTQIEDQGGSDALGLIRGVTEAILLVRPRVQLLSGHWPGPNEILVGRLAGAKLGRAEADLAPGRTLTFEGKTWTISGRFSSGGGAHEAEIWCPLDELQAALKRQDLCLVALRLAPGADPAQVDIFCKERLEYELEATGEVPYYQNLHKHYGPIRMTGWLVAILLAGAGFFAGLNTMFGAVVGRVRELATLQTLGYVRRAIALALLQEGTLLAAAASLAASLLALGLINGLAVRFTMGAFTLRIDGLALLIGCGAGLLLGFLGSIPPALRAMRLPIVEGLKAV